MPRPSHRAPASRLVALAAGVSLLVCVGIVVLWVRSYRLMDQFSATARDRLWCVESRRGRLTLTVVRGWPGDKPLRWHADACHPPGPPLVGASRTRWARLGLAGEYGTGITPTTPDGRACWDPPARWFPRVARGLSARMDYWAVDIPHGLPGALLAAFPVAYGGYLVRRRRRVTTGMCPTCGYDLRASPDRCPECGTPLPTNTRRAA